MSAVFRRKNRSEQERFYDFALPEPNSGCWLWIGALYGSGYGVFNTSDDRTMHAHRYSWMLHRGEIPDGLIVCHKCDVRCCVNPEHLFVGTHSDNANDMHAKGRNNTPRGEQHVRSKLSEQDVRNIRVDIRALSTIGNDYGVDKQYIWKIKHGWHWEHVK